MRAIQYVALTRRGDSPWWIVYAGEPGESEASVKGEALSKLMGHSEPQHTVATEPGLHLTVISRSAAQRAFSEAWRAYEYQARAGAPH